MYTILLVISGTVCVVGVACAKYSRVWRVLAVLAVPVFLLVLPLVK